MKYLISFALLLVTSLTVQSQTTFEYGLKGGISYSMGGEIQGNDSGVGYWGGIAEGEGAVGYHGGVFGQVNFGKFFVRPEVVYSSLTQKFDIPLREEKTDYSVQTFTIPLLLGYNIYGPLDLYAGPVFTNILDSSIFGVQGDPVISVQNRRVNIQAGAKVEFGRFGLDVRYERSLSDAQDSGIDFDNDLFGGKPGANDAKFTDARLNQIIVSFIFKIGGPDLNNGRRRRPCY